MGSVQLDGLAVPADQFTSVAGSTFSIAQVSIEPGTHVLAGPLAFGAIVYGFGPDESYGYPAGLAVDPETPLIASGLELTPETMTSRIGTGVLFAAAVVDQVGDPLPGVAVRFAVSGENTAADFVLTDIQGIARFTYSGIQLGRDTVTASAGLVNDSGQVDWIADPIDVVIDSPMDGSEVPAGQTVLVSGSIVVDESAEIIAVKLGGNPVDAIDAAGNFFSPITVSPGVNTITVTALDSLGQTETQTITIRGTQAQNNPTDLNLFTDVVSASFIADYTHTSLDQASDRLYTELAIQNAGSFPIDTPLFVAIDNLSDPGIYVVRPDGFTPEGLPYYDYSGLVDDGTLDAGESTAAKTIAFFNPGGTQFTYELVYFGQTNQAPAIGSSPEQAAIIGKPYFYQVVATDPDGDPLEYRLTAGPEGIGLDAVSGKMTWTPTANDLGGHDVQVEVSDGRGGFAQQRYSLVVSLSPPNRPPLFQSTPTVLANVGAEYVYTPIAKDADDDDLVFTLNRAPDGAQINAQTGEVSWTPGGTQAGLQSLTIIADDNRGGLAEQSFRVLVARELGDQAPIIITTPTTFGVSGTTYDYDVDAQDADGDPIRYSLADAPVGMTIDPQTGQIRWDVSEITVLDFDDLAHDGTSFTSIDKLGNDPLALYERGGYAIEALSPNLLGLGSYGSASTEFTGSSAMANRTVTGVTELRRSIAARLRSTLWTLPKRDSAAQQLPP